MPFGDYLREARSGGGPYLLECLTHRRRGHYDGDQQSYRDELAEAEWARLDPIARLHSVAAERGWLDNGEAGTLEGEARAAVEAAVQFARSSPPLKASAAADVVYAR